MHTMRTILYFLTPLALLLSVSCGEAQTTAHTDFAPAAMQKAITAAPGIVLDVRTPEEFAEGHVQGAVNVDWYNPAFLTEVSAFDKKKPVYVYCAVGGRSSKAKAALVKAGFSEVHNLTGGIEAWQEAGLPVTR